jgi:hypothetical protein
MIQLLFVLTALIAYALPIVLTVGISSLLRKTPVRNGFIGLGWSIIVLFGAGILAGLVPPFYRSGVLWILGGVITLLIARRGRYRLDVQSWILLFLFAPGWWLLFWRRSNKMWRQQQPAITAGAAVATT